MSHYFVAVGIACVVLTLIGGRRLLGLSVVVTIAAFALLIIHPRI